MKKYVFLIDTVALMCRVLAGKRVQGVLYLDDETGRLTFRANGEPQGRVHDELIVKTPWGWVKRSRTRLKRFSSVPLDMTASVKMAAFDRENEAVKDIVVDEELIEFC